MLTVVNVDFGGTELKCGLDNNRMRLTSHSVEKGTCLWQKNEYRSLYNVPSKQ